MNKPNLLKFIDLYNLSGIIEKVKLEADGKALKVGMVSEDRTLMGSVTFDGLKFEAGEYPVYDTAQFKKMLGILDDEVEVVVNKYNNVANALVFSDKNTEVFITLADSTVIPENAYSCECG